MGAPDRPLSFLMSRWGDTQGRHWMPLINDAALQQLGLRYMKRAGPIDKSFA